jgi:TonB family protein
VGRRDSDGGPLAGYNLHIGWIRADRRSALGDDVGQIAMTFLTRFGSLALVASVLVGSCATGTHWSTPRPLNTVVPRYPAHAKAHGIERDVAVAVTVGVDGRTENVRVVRSGGAEFDEAAVEMAKQLIYEPARRDGFPTRFRIAFTVRFRIDEVTGDVSNPEQAWDDFWRVRGVSPAPPRGFLDDLPPPLPEILNLTNGALSDATVRRWVIADLRRGKGDGWAFRHLRLDLANADVFGPPGLNGTDRSISDELAKGAVERVPQPSVVVAAGVVAISKDVQERIPWARLTKFVIVQTFRATGTGGERVLADGRREPVPGRHPAGELSWQLDTGEFRDNPVVGELWYQARGWSCKTEGSNQLLDEICGLLGSMGERAEAAAQPRGVAGALHAIPRDIAETIEGNVFQIVRKEPQPRVSQHD